ncbi:hypothetical protein NQ314_002825 [Rhamnusium bicolor]|uniref:Fringe-like glycosyltransferase domain-containing protein n=1 Tax=Rhamnusium bicolor TaxID=1586634 RepID=A0AAV8ZP34_9CUCU|nr:hypothetical protein NQ314_002825 [Rhamnusium bicolor]
MLYWYEVSEKSHISSLYILFNGVLYFFLVSDIKSIVFVVLSQENKYNLRQAENVTTDLLHQSELLYQEIWFGNALHDNEATIIHHFAFSENPEYFKYPNIASGFAISITLLNRLSSRIKESTSTSDFSIDSSHELALFIWNKGAGQMLQHESALCNREQPHCAAFPTSFRVCGSLVPKTSLYFAVKTCKKFHKDRVPVIKKTWSKHLTRVTFFSDVEDDSIPTVNLGIQNTDQGHCAKTLGILGYVAKEIQNDTNIRWIIIADDDTILRQHYYSEEVQKVVINDTLAYSVHRMQQLLTCYDASEEVALGERYGYNVLSPRGYNYITGGGGMVFSRPLLDKLIQKGVCDCPSLNTPDDMFLGICIAGLGVSVTHSPFFHQARPVDYAFGYLETQDAVSFHKHWMIDPVKVYKKWFEDSDKFNADTNSINRFRNEL